MVMSSTIRDTVAQPGRAAPLERLPNGGSPNDSPAWIVEWKFSPLDQVERVEVAVGGKPSRARRLSTDTAPITPADGQLGDLDDRAYWRMAVR